VADETSLAHRTAAILVVYRLEHPIDEVLARLGDSVRTCIVVDNSEMGHGSLPALTARHGAMLLKAGNRGGLAGAYNLALDHLRRHDRGPVDFVVFLDEDSDPAALRGLLADPACIERLTRVDTAAVAPAYRDRATGLRGKYIELERFRLTYLSRQFTDLRAVAFVINSMSVWRMDALSRIGAFNEGLAIDHVDTEYCLRARALGLAVYVHGAHEFAHSIGQRRRFRFLGREMQAGGHGPARRYLIGRNTAWLARTWLWREPAFAFLCVSRLGYEVVGILIAEDQATCKLLALLRGAAVGLVSPRLT
jgi:rhamnosyltransferase